MRNEYDNKFKASKTNYNFCSIFACNVENFLDTLLDDTDHEEAYLLMFLDYIICWLNETEEKESYEVEKYLSNKLIQTEFTKQSADMT